MPIPTKRENGLPRTRYSSSIVCRSRSTNGPMMAPGHAGPDGALNMVKRVPVQIEQDVEQATTTGLSAQLSSSSQSSVIGSFEQIYGIEQRPARSLRRSREADRVPTSRIDQIALPGELKRSEACRAGPSGPPA